MSRNVLPAKKLSSASSRPTTPGLAPSGKAAVEEKVDAIVAESRARLAREAQEKEEEEEKRRGPAPGDDAEVTGRALWADPDSDLGPEDLEKAFYACLAQVDLCIEAMNVGVSVQQLVAAKEVEAEVAARKTTEAAASGKSGVKAKVAGAPVGEVRPAGELAAPSKAAKTAVTCMKHSSGGTPASSTKRARKKPVSLGTHDG